MCISDVYIRVYMCIYVCVSDLYVCIYVCMYICISLSTHLLVLYRSWGGDKGARGGKCDNRSGGASTSAAAAAADLLDKGTGPV